MELLDLPDAFLGVVVSYATANDLCALDVTCRRLAALTDTVWKTLAMESFGIEVSVPRVPTGKAAWRKGKALTSPGFALRVSAN